MNPVQRVLAKNYEPGIAVVDFAWAGSTTGLRRLLRHLRDRCGGTRSPSPRRRTARTAIVRNKLEWQSNRLAKRLTAPGMWRDERALNHVVRPLLAGAGRRSRSSAAATTTATTRSRVRSAK